MTAHYPTPAPAPRPSNGLGIAAFIVSLIGIPVCFLAPIALLLSFIALFKRPRGFAFAGFVISFVITAILVTIVGLFGLTLFSAIKFGAPGVATFVSSVEAAQRIENVAMRNGGTYPDELTGNLEIGTIKDGWGKPFQYSRLPAGGFEIRSAGIDGIFDTKDDIRMPFTETRRVAPPQPSPTTTSPIEQG